MSDFTHRIVVGKDNLSLGLAKISDDYYVSICDIECAFGVYRKNIKGILEAGDICDKWKSGLKTQFLPLESFKKWAKNHQTVSASIFSHKLDIKNRNPRDELPMFEVVPTLKKRDSDSKKKRKHNKVSPKKISNKIIKATDDVVDKVIDEINEKIGGKISNENVDSGNKVTEIIADTTTEESSYERITPPKKRLRFSNEDARLNAIYRELDTLHACKFCQKSHVDKKLFCISCGKIQPISCAKYCYECGTMYWGV